MKKPLNADALHRIADEIDHNCMMLELSDEDTAREDLDFYLPRIRQCADELNRLSASETKKDQAAATEEGGAG